jgi:mono/diheme cytochrome c family protein
LIIQKGTGLSLHRRMPQVSNLRPGFRPHLIPGFRLLLLSALPAALLVLAGCHSQPPLTPQQAAGQHLYAVRCAHCHEENDLALKPPPPNIHGAMGKAKLPSGALATDAEVRRLVLVGKGKMPSFSGRFTEEQMAALLAYLHTDMPLPEQ